MKYQRVALFGLLAGLVFASAIICAVPSVGQGTSSVTISSPANNSKVRYNVTVTGTAANIPSGQRLWLVVYNHDERLYYPQEGPIIPFGGTWDSQAYLGTKNEGNGEEYRIIAALTTTSDANANFTSLYKSNKGVTELRQDVNTTGYVTVTRDDSVMPSPSVSPTPISTISTTVPLSTTSATSGSATLNATSSTGGGSSGLPGFEALYAVAGFLVIAYLATRHRR